MFGFFRTLVYMAIIVVVGCGFFAWHYRVPTTRYLLSHVLNNPLSIGDLDISLSLSRVNGKNVGIINPPRSREDKRFVIEARFVEFRAKLINWFKKTLVIEEISLDRVDFFVDMYNIVGSESNVKTVIGNIKARAEERHPEGKEHKRPVIINKIILQDINFSYRNPFLTAGITKLEPVHRIEIDNVGTGHPVSAGQIASLITTTLLKHFASLSGFKHTIESLPKLPIFWFKNIFIKHGSADAVSLDAYLDLPESQKNQAAGFFKKIFLSPRKQEDETE